MKQEIKSGSEIGRSAGTVFSRIAFGLSLGSSITGLILGNIFGFVLRIVVLFRGAPTVSGRQFAHVDRAVIAHIFRKYKEFPLVSVPEGLMWGLYQMIDGGEFAEGSRIVALHTGGSQNNVPA